MKSESPSESAKQAGLSYVTLGKSGLTRRKAGRGWVYIDADGKRVRDAAQLERIRSLVIPPAWTKVWICSSANGHLQATGIDAKGRKQYLYHKRYRRIRDATKYDRLAPFGKSLPLIRARVTKELRLDGLPKEKVVAAVVRLLDQVSGRVGNLQYVRDNDSFGITTLRNRHAKVKGQVIKIKFRGKSGQEHELELSDRRLAKIIRQCQDLPGQELFQYLNGDAEPSKICSEDVNEYLRETTGQDFTAKDFRTWNGTREAVTALYAAGPAESETDLQRNTVQAIKTVAGVLGNRPATCRKYYIHPAVFEAYEQALIAGAVEASRKARRRGLSAEERAVMTLVMKGQKQPRRLRAA